MSESTQSTRKKHQEFGARKRALFLENLRKYGSVYFSCVQAGIDRSTAYKARDRDPEFAQQWADAIEDGLDLLEASAAKRAHTSSDTLAIFLLKAGRPKKYRDPVVRYAETDAEGNDKSGLTDDELLERAAAVIAKRKANAT